MADQVRCPECGRTYAIGADLAGKSARCPGCGHTFRVSRIGRYQVLSELGRGSFGVVHRVFDPKIGREAAVKVLHAEVVRRADASEALRRFRNEARLLAQIVHPNILPLYEADEHEGRLYLVTALIRGRQLDELVPPEGFPDPRRAVELAVPLLEALHHVHATYGICHRDVKPANIMVGEGGAVFLMDFGLAVCGDPDGTRLTLSGTAVGTPAYMPPEQAEGNLANVGPRSDQYSAGVVLFHMLTGEAPFRKPLPALLTDIVSAPPPRPSALRPDLDPELDRIVLRALEKDPRARFPDCHQFAEQLLDWAGRQAAAGGARRAWSQARLRGRAKLWAAASGVVLAALLLGGGYVLIRKGTAGGGSPPATSMTTRKGERHEWQGD